MSIPFVDLAKQQRRIRADLDRRITRVLAHGNYVLGPEVSELEAALSIRASCRHCIAVSSGTDALLVALLAKNIGPGDAVFLPSFTFTATAEVVLQAGAYPIFVDVDASTFNIDPISLRAALVAISSGRKLRPAAIIAVDLFGQPADYTTINALAEEYGIFVLADAAQSFGATYQDHAVGNLADITATSFYPAKPLGCYGDGGAIFTDSDELATACISLRAHGHGKQRYDIVRLGLNARLDTLQAAVLLAKLNIFDDEIRMRQWVAQKYIERLEDLVEVPLQLPRTETIWAQFTIKVPHRDATAAFLRERDIPTQIYYPLPMHLQPAYREYGDGQGSLPVSEALCQQVLALPMHPYLDESTIGMVCDALHDKLG